MDCPKCGTHNLDSAERCRMCGESFRAEKLPGGPSKTCPFCKTANDPEAPYCANCGRYLDSKGTDSRVSREERKKKEHVRRYEDYPASAQRTAWSSSAGIMMIIVAMVLVLDIAFTMAESYRETQLSDFDRAAEQYPALKSFLANVLACESIRMVFALLAFVGALAAVRRLNFGLAVVGGVSGVIGLMMSISALVYYAWALAIGVAFLTALLALGMLVLSRKEFLLT